MSRDWCPGSNQPPAPNAVPSHCSVCGVIVATYATGNIRKHKPPLPVLESEKPTGETEITFGDGPHE